MADSYILREMVTLKKGKDDAGTIVSMKFTRFSTLDEANTALLGIHNDMMEESKKDAMKREAEGKAKVRPKYKSLYCSKDDDINCYYAGVVNSRTPMKTLVYEYIVIRIKEPDGGIFSAVNNTLLDYHQAYDTLE